MKKIVLLLLLSFAVISCGKDGDGNKPVPRKLVSKYSGRVSYSGNYTGRQFLLYLYDDNTYSESISVVGNPGAVGSEHLMAAYGDYAIEENTIVLAEQAEISVYMRIYEYGGTSEIRTTTELSSWFPVIFYMEGNLLTSDTHPTGYKVSAAKN